MADPPKPSGPAIRPSSSNTKNPAENRDCLQRAIDAEIKALEESIQVLKLRRNALSPILSLPPEIFAAIFSFLGLPGTPHHHLARLRVSHVCHRWREIALNQPLLWSHVNLTSLSLGAATEICSRAKVFSHRWEDFSTFVQAHIPRIYHLSIYARYLQGNLERRIREFLSPAPTLKYLSLSSRTKGEEEFIPDTLFNGSTPRLSCLGLCNCNISWKSPLLKGLKYLQILTPSENARPDLAVWLDALNEMPQLKVLTLHSVSPIAPPLPYDVERTVTLPSLTHLDISAYVGDCALALAHLDLPTLTSLYLTVIFDHIRADVSDVQAILPYVTRHAHGPQDIQPLQSVHISSDSHHLNILAWPVPDIGVEMNDPPTLLGMTIPTRVALSLENKDWDSRDTHPKVLDTVMAGLPLDGLVMLVAQDLDRLGPLAKDLSTQQFWLRLSRKWPLLRRVRVAHPVDRGFIEMLREDNGGRDGPLLPSLTELALVYGGGYGGLDAQWTQCLCDAFMRRVEQGVPLETLDLRMYYYRCGPAEVQLLSEIVVDVLLPEEHGYSGSQMSSWKNLASGPFLKYDNPHDEDD